MAALGKERDERRLSARILVCDVDKLLGFGSNERDENLWMESPVKLSEALTGVGVILGKDGWQIHCFGGFNGKEFVNTHSVLDVRDVLSSLVPAKRLEEIVP